MLVKLNFEINISCMGMCAHAIFSHLPVLVRELERLHQPEGLVDVPPDGQVVDGDLAKLASAVDDEEAAEGDALVLLKKKRN